MAALLYSSYCADHADSAFSLDLHLRLLTQYFADCHCTTSRSCKHFPKSPPSLSLICRSVTSSRLVQSILWTLNGFGKLRDRPELEDIEPRYIPDVFSTSPSLGVSACSRASEEGAYLAALNAEDWFSRGPSQSKHNGESQLWSCLDYHEAYRSGKLTPVDVVEALLPLVMRNADEKVGDKHSTAFLSVKAELVRKAAEESAGRWRSGKPRSLIDGVVMVSAHACASSQVLSRSGR